MEQNNVCILILNKEELDIKNWCWMRDSNSRRGLNLTDYKTVPFVHSGKPAY